MAYLVNISARAERDLSLIFDAIHVERSEAAVTWYSGLREAILSLEEKPNRCPETPETSRLRHLLYGHKPHVYRVIYWVTESSRQVDILHVRHGARQRFRPSDVK